MCDYSLQTITSRPAEVGDELITCGFANSLTRGFCAVDEPEVAVCLQPGTEVVFATDAEYDLAFPWPLLMFSVGKLWQRVARFRQVNVTRRYVHHDALEFADGKVILVTRLCLGQRAKVLQLPAASPGVSMKSDELREIAPVE